ncbi:hypothetical protein V8C86DRAFT_423498 [Haematococcus lacustris]
MYLCCSSRRRSAYQPAAGAAHQPRPAAVDAAAAARARALVGTQAAWATDLLQMLVSGQLVAPQGLDTMPASILNACEGLAFMQSRKGGLGLTLGSGSGFVVKKLNQDVHGGSSWSPPWFFLLGQAGVGLSAGYRYAQTVTALLSLDAFQVFEQGTTGLGTDLGAFSTDGALTGLAGGLALGKGQQMGMNLNSTRSAFNYSAVEGVYLEVALHGSRISPDTATNTALYGQATANDVLEGRLGGAVDKLPEMLPLVRRINKLGKAAAAGQS